MSGSKREYCHYCAREVFEAGSVGAEEYPRQLRTRDHVNSSSSGKKIDHQSNIVVACFECNTLKADTPYEVFTYYLRQVGVRHGLSNQKAYRKFCYDLMRAGFAAAFALINYRNKLEKGDDAPQMSRRRRAALDAPAITASRPAPRDSRGRYTLRDLRKPVMPTGRKHDRAVVQEAQRAIAKLDALEIGA